MLAGCQESVTIEIGDQTTTPTEEPMQEQHNTQRTGQFVVEFDSEEVSGWKTISLPAVSVEEGTYREDTDGSEDEHTIVQPAYGDLEMEREMIDSELWDWAESLIQGRLDNFSKEITLTLTDEASRTEIRWEFADAWLKNYEQPELDASDDTDTVTTERLTVGFDTMTRDVQ